MSVLTQLAVVAAKHGLHVTLCDGYGHYKIEGKGLVVNYWPESKRRTAYVQGTTTSKTYVSFEQACAMALTPPAVVVDYSRRGNTRRQKIRMLRKSTECHWCHRQLSIDGEYHDTVPATIDHVIPLSRGGLDNSNNMVLACGQCNHDRANHMPEVGKEQEWKRYDDPTETAATAYGQGFEACRALVLQIVDEHDGYLSRVESLEVPAYEGE